MKLVFSVDGKAAISAGGEAHWVNEYFKSALWQAADGSQMDKVVFEKLHDGAIDIKWQSHVRQQCVPLFKEVLQNRPVVKVLSFKLPRPCGSHYLWDVMSLAALLPRDGTTYKRTDAVGVRMWVKNGITHQWSSMFEKFGFDDQDVLLPSAAGHSTLQNEGYLVSTGVALCLVCHWSRQAASAQARACAEALLEHMLRKFLPVQFELEVRVNPQYQLFPEASRVKLRIKVSRLEVNLDQVAHELKELSHHLPLKNRNAVLLAGGGVRSVVEWLQVLSSRPLARWFARHMFSSLALELGASWDDAHDALALCGCNCLTSDIAQTPHCGGRLCRPLGPSMSAHGSVASPRRWADQRWARAATIYM